MIHDFRYHSNVHMMNSLVFAIRNSLFLSFSYRLYDIGFPEKRFPDVGSIKTERHKIVTS